jgi:hypothetical protein
MRRRQFLSLALPVVAAGCSAPVVWAPDDEVERVVQPPVGPPALTLFTVISNETEDGAHSGLLINAPEQRVLFDPAGTWYHPAAAERNDLHYGISERVLAHYLDYHTRITYRTVVQRIEVAPEIASRALALAQQAGPVPQALCAMSISGLLRELPGFERLPRTYFPRVLSRAFGALPGVATETRVDDDADFNRDLLVGR